MVSKRANDREIAPDEIFLDSSNLPGRNDPQIEARVVRFLGNRSIVGIGVVFAIVTTIFSARSFELGIVHGTEYAEISRENRLDHSIIFAARGIIYDRTRREIAWNTAPASSTPGSFALRKYIDMPGLSLILGFVKYPKADDEGYWWREETMGVSGSEGVFDEALRGKNGSIMVETDALGNKERQGIVMPTQNGSDIRLSIDAEVQSKLFSLLSTHAARQGFIGGAAAIMDVRTGELLALTSFPEYDNRAFTSGDASTVRKTSTDPATPLLNRAVSGLYAPGSIVKPIFAAAALNERIIDPEKKILSTGAITIPNPYDPKHPSVYRDWTVHGLVNMREAIAVSSDEYFYQIGGGYGSQKGLGIGRLEEYARRFGLGAPTGIELMGEERGVIPTPEWKAAVFQEDDPWNIGNTYHTAIGQYGFQITPLQAVSFTAAIANGGKLLRPSILIGSPYQSGVSDYTDVGIPDSYIQIVREGMRLAVTSTRSDATVKVLNISGLPIAAKTGTAQIGAKNQW
ncbi:MAG: penicillin-binding transpeptidase domain-containing protein, partial [Patescibacteria group bacterium]